MPQYHYNALTFLRMLSSVWLEHLPYKQRVIGSSPIASTIHHRPIPQFFKIDKRRDDLSFCLLFSAIISLHPAFFHHLYLQGFSLLIIAMRFFSLI